MKKLFSIIAVICLIGAFAMPTMACEGPECGPDTATGNYYGQAYSSDFDSSATGWWGGFNDSAYGEAQGSAGGAVDTYANSGHYEQVLVGYEYEGESCWYGFCTGYFSQKEHPEMIQYKVGYPSWAQGWDYLGAHKVPVYEEVPVGGDSFEMGSLFAFDKSKTWSYAKDFGMTSIAGAGAKTEGFVMGSGLAIGRDGCDELVNIDLTLKGDVYQYNTAGETGYPGGDFAQGSSGSGAFFTATKLGSDSGSGFAMDMAAIHGSAITMGNTSVTIDPYGPHQSLSAHTDAMSAIQVCGADTLDATVYGGGGVAGMVSSMNGLTYGGGQATFDYLGNVAGSGAANLNVNLYTGPTSSSVSVSGSSHASSN